MNICVIGTGFVGVVSAAVYASFGNQVFGLDIDPNKIEKLKQGKVPFFEPDLENLLVEQQKTGNLFFTTSYEEAIKEAEVIIIAVGTPSGADGQADLRYVMMAGESLAPYLQQDAIVVIKSTVPPGTLSKLEERIRTKTSTPFSTASLPEFLKEGTAVYDTLHPDRVVIGATDAKVFTKLTELHAPLNTQVVKVSPESAQMAKYTANAYLATRITFINQIADLCEKNGADIQDVIEAIGFDKRIGKHYWYPGFGYGGSCFPKDVKELAAYSRSVGESNNLLNKINEINEQRIPKLFDTYCKVVGDWENKKVAVLGIAFKPNTDDTREAPATKVVPYLLQHGATVTSYDPKAVWQTTQISLGPDAKFSQVQTMDEAVQDADVIIALIEWPEITSYDFAQARVSGKPQWFIDARNQFSPEDMTSLGFSYIGVGR